MTWRDLENEAPDIARRGRGRFEEVGVALLGTLRRDGSPRVSPVEPRLVEGHLVFGVMPWSGKARDLARDSRCALHSAVCDPDNPAGELKLYGRAREVEDPELRAADPGAWWVERPAEEARVFSLDIEAAAFITWDAVHGVMCSRRWSSETGLRESERRYP
jgi:Pyridoxamine 5'-phosphate oxidase